MLQNKQFLDKQLSRSSCFNFMHCAKKNDLLLARLPGISAIWMKIIKRYNFQDFANISKNFRWNTKFR